MTIVKEPAIAVDAGVCSLLENFRDAFTIQTGRQFSARCILYAMDWPKSLRQTIQINLFEYSFPGWFAAKLP